MLHIKVTGFTRANLYRSIPKSSQKYCRNYSNCSAKLWATKDPKLRGPFGWTHHVLANATSFRPLSMQRDANIDKWHLKLPKCYLKYQSATLPLLLFFINYLNIYAHSSNLNCLWENKIKLPNGKQICGSFHGDAMTTSIRGWRDETLR